jgi:tRNA A-37 threonylcarbamoyl transferase component Bud32
MFDIANGIEILHLLNIEHGDLTPDNVGYRKSSDSFVIFDFGASKIHDIKPDYNFYLKDIQRLMRSLQTTYGKYFTDFEELYGISSLINEQNVRTPSDFKKIVNRVFEDMDESLDL